MGSLDRQREVTRSLFPWMRQVSLSARALVIGSATKLIELAGGGSPVVRVVDVRGLVFDPGVPGFTAPAMYYSSDGGKTFGLVAQVAPGSTMGGTVPPLPGTTVTPVAPSGSARVTCG